MSEDLARFLADRYDEAEARARAAMADTRHCERCDAMASGEWAIHPAHPPLLRDEGSDATIVYDEGHGDLLAYIAANDPAHRLADIKLKRAILAEHRHYDEHAHTGIRSPAFGCELCHYHSEYGIPYGINWCATVRQLSTEFASHPAYKPGWAPEGETDGT